MAEVGSTMLDYALRYAALGWHVVPCHSIARNDKCTCGKANCSSPGKHPRTQHGLKDASTEDDQIRTWWDRWPKANIAVVTGRLSGFWTLDIDAKHGGGDTLDALQAKHGKLPDTVEALTGGGGRHLLFSMPDCRVPNSVAQIGPGIDVRGDDGYIVVAPSVHISGKIYEWEASSEPGDVPIVPAPAWLLSLTTEKKHKSLSPDFGDSGDKIRSGGRNQFCFSHACSMRRKQFSTAAILAAILQLNRERCDPPLDDSEVEHLVKSSARYDEEKIWTSTEWLSQLDRTDKGVLKPTLKNALLIIENDMELTGRIHMDEFRHQIITSDVLPFRKSIGQWVDTDTIELAAYMDNGYKAAFKTSMAHEAVLAIARRKAINELRDYLFDCAAKWDGVERVHHFFADYYDADDTEYTRSVSANFLISCVARVLTPGCPADNMVVIEGAQGIGKTRSLRAIAGQDWYMEVSTEWGSKDFFQSLRGKWICEVGELSAIRRSQIERVKQILTSTHDNYRPAYGRFSEDFPRSNIFVGTTNEDRYLIDSTGNRRFWPILARTADFKRIALMRDQIWGEAVVRFRRGESWWVVPEEETKFQQEMRYDEDVWAEHIAIWIVGRDEITMAEVLDGALKIEPNRQDRASQMRCASIVKRLGFRKVVTKEKGRSAKVWRRIPDNEEGTLYKK